MRTGRGDIELYSFLISAQQRHELSDSGPERITTVEKVPHYTLNRRLDGPESRYGQFRKQINFLPLPGLASRFPQPRSLLTTKH
jgi:hypothetical protein